MKLCYSVRFPSVYSDLDVSQLHMDATIPPVWQQCGRGIESAEAADFGNTTRSLHSTVTESVLLSNSLLTSITQSKRPRPCMPRNYSAISSSRGPATRALKMLCV